MPLSNLKDALVHQMKDLLSAEKQLAQALPKMARAATDEELRQAFEQHAAETKEQVKRIEQVFRALDMTPRAHKCEAMQGLIEEGQEVLEAKKVDDEVRDALLIASAQKVEHYEIASYGCACTWAALLGFDDVAELLQETMAEEKATDEKLTTIAERINEEAAAPVG